jgi:hypothetical protein
MSMQQAKSTTSILIGWLALMPIASVTLAQESTQVTFTRDLAPILYEHCIKCHRPGEIAPFPLVTYDDVSERGERIARATSSREMPPWQPAHGYQEFVGERWLPDNLIERITQWVAQGMPEGDPAELPELPGFPDEWRLGDPDLVLEMAVPFTLPEEGHDVYRNFVLETGLTEDKWVRAVELRPTVRAAAHHALFAYVEAGSYSATDGEDGQPGFGGAMAVGFVPGQGNSGSLGGWAVGGRAMVFPEGAEVTLPADSDFLLQMHFHLTGDAALERAQVGLYFTDEPPSKAMASIELPALFGFGAGIDIPAEETNYMVSDTFSLPSDVLVYSAWGHAHRLAKELKIDATLPDGSTSPLFWIPDWDFNWQEIYQYQEPVLLPKGTRLESTIRYDNSVGNGGNPNDPPERVRWGLESADEMGTVGLLVEILEPEQVAAFRQSLTERTQSAIQRGVVDGTVQRYLQQQATVDVSR